MEEVSFSHWHSVNIWMYRVIYIINIAIFLSCLSVTGGSDGVHAGAAGKALVKDRIAAERGGGSLLRGCVLFSFILVSVCLVEFPRGLLFH